MDTRPFALDHLGRTLHGLIDRPPPGVPANGYGVILVHGHGRTEVVDRDWYRPLREAFTAAGLICATWDKPGCGRSEGPYDRDQTVVDSAAEVVAAMAELSGIGAVARDRIGLWGISRAGWIGALAIRSAPEIAFWISSSPGGDHDNYPYLLRQNLRLEGRSEAYIATILDEIRLGFHLLAEGASYQRFLAATATFHGDPFIAEMCPGGPQNAEDYLREMAKAREWQSVLPGDFAGVLECIACPVLALFGELDLVVDWRDSRALYERCLARHGNLTVRTFPGMNHGLSACRIGSLREARERRLGGMDPECIRAMVAWLVERGFARREAAIAQR